MPVEIAFRDLYIPLGGGAEGEPDRAPLSTLDDDERSHVHGTLWIRVNGRDLPALGCFGVDDVCMGTWAHELAAAARRLVAADPGSYAFDEGEQGQPSFEFERRGESLTIRVEASIYATDISPPPWEPQACSFAEFQTEVALFLERLDRTVSAASPAGEGWVHAQLGQAG